MTKNTANNNQEFDKELRNVLTAISVTAKKISDRIAFGGRAKYTNAELSALAEELNRYGKTVIRISGILAKMAELERRKG